MARRLPRPLARRDVLYGVHTPKEKLVEFADAYLEEGLLFDAADFFVEARDRDGLSRIRKAAIESGDAFLLWRVKGSMPELVSKADWDELARIARSLGKPVYAERAAAGGAPPPPPLAEEIMGEAAPAESAAEEDEAERPDGAKDGSGKPRPGKSGRRRRKKEIQGG
ncbi:MAG: hypothetical protein ACYSU0_03360 [Planctomycetota bacterium]|jgi:hypothetical protein